MKLLKWKDVKRIGGSPLSWPHTVEYMNKTYYYYGEFFKRSRLNEVVSELEAEDYDVVVIRGLTHIVYTNPLKVREYKQTRLEDILRD